MKLAYYICRKLFKYGSKIAFYYGEKIIMDEHAPADNGRTE